MYQIIGPYGPIGKDRNLEHARLLALCISRVDFGYTGPGSIGDRVWNDRNGDGVQDAGEGGLAGVIVFIDIDDDGSRDAGEPFDTTDVTGAYDITDLAAGSYTVRVDAATLPAGVVLTGGSEKAELEEARARYRAAQKLKGKR